MPEAGSQTSLYDRFPNLGRLTISIIEHMVEPVLGRDAIALIAEPHKHRELYLKLCAVLETTEQRFVKEYTDSDIAKGLLHLPLSNLNSVRAKFWEFCKNPADPKFSNFLYEQFCSDHPNIDDAKRQKAVAAYIAILRAEMISIDEETRQKISAIALLNIETNVEKISSTLGSIDKSTKVIADALLQKIPIEAVPRADLPKAPQEFPRKFRKYLEQLQSSILEVFRQDQHVLLSVEALVTEDPDTLHTLQQALRSAYSIQVEDVRGKAATPQYIEETTANHRLIVLLGDPGIGKTTSLRYLALRQIEKVLDRQSEQLPIWVTLSQWLDSDVSAKEFIWQEFTKLLGSKKVISHHEFDGLLKDGKAIIFLDGLNEIPHRQQEGQELPPEVRDKKSSENKTIDVRENGLTLYAREVQSQFVLSCRILEYIHLPGWWEYRVLPLNDQQAKELVEKHLGNKGRQLQAILDNQPELKELTKNAFFLRSLIRLVQENWKQIPTDRFELVQFTCWVAIHREAGRQGIDPNDKIQLIGKISFEAMEVGLIGSTIEFPFETAHGVEVEKNKKQPIEVMQFCEAAGLIVRIQVGNNTVTYRYLHQLVQEALALIYLKQETSEKDTPSEIDSLIQIGRIHFYWGKLKEAQENFLKALELCPTIGLVEPRVIILINLSSIYRYWRQPKEAINFAEKAIQLANMDQPTLLLASTYHELGNVYLRLWRLKESENAYLQALEVYGKLDDKRNYAYEILYGIADFYENPRVYQCMKALSLYDKALFAFEELYDMRGRASTYLSKASTFRLWGNVGESEKFFKKSIAEFRQLNERWQLQNALEFLGFLYRDTDRLEDAIPILEEAYQLGQELGDVRSQINILISGFAWVNSYQNKHNVAMDYLDSALKLANQISEPTWLADVYISGYVPVCWRAKRYQEVYQYVQEFRKYVDEEYVVSFADMLFIKWSEVLGNNIIKSKVRKSISNFLVTIYVAYYKLKNPSHWLGRVLWRIAWRINNLRNWSRAK